jgi:uncharacterized protein
MVRIYFLFFFYILSTAVTNAQAVSFGVEKQSADFLSDGTRIHAEIYRPKSNDANEKFPVVIMSHGWGGTADLLSDTAHEISQAGFIVIVIDYRGWGKSDSRLIQIKSKNGKYTSTREMREVVDPLDQAEDIFSTINWASSDSQFDKQNIGLWGTSFSGGLVVYVASRDKRVKALVSQVGAMGWGEHIEKFSREWNSKGAQRARGEIDYPQPGVKEVGNLKGGIIWEKLSRFNPIQDSANLKNTAALFIVAKNEELFRNEDHSLAAYNKIDSEKEYLVIPNIKHYDIYSGTTRKLASKAAINWFEKYLK